MTLHRLLTLAATALAVTAPAALATTQAAAAESPQPRGTPSVRCC